MYPGLTSAHTGPLLSPGLQSTWCLEAVRMFTSYWINIRSYYKTDSLKRWLTHVSHSKKLVGGGRGKSMKLSAPSLEINYINTKAFSFVMTRFPGHLVKILCILAICCFSLVRNHSLASSGFLIWALLAFCLLHCKSHVCPPAMPILVSRYFLRGHLRI